MSVEFQRLAIPDVVLIKPKVFRDPRGYFVETWQSQRFAAAGLDVTFVQDNLSRSTQYALRGLHYQIQQSQGKLVRAVTGSIFDVAVDLRRSSPTFGKWVGEVLSEDNQHQLWVPPGFAHGFVVLSESAHFSYKCSDFYAPQFERTIRWDDPELDIRWPVPADANLTLSKKDSEGTAFRNAEAYP